MAVPALIIFGKMHFLLISENEFFHEIKYCGMTSFMEFVFYVLTVGLQWTQTANTMNDRHNIFADCDMT